MARRSSRKRRKERRRAAAGRPPAGPTVEGPDSEASGAGAEGADTLARGYARGRARDEAARAALKPLAKGERPAAVTAGALVAAALALAEVVSFALAYDSDDGGGRVLRSVLVVGLLGVMSWGMWRVRYWAVLGMQTLLGITILGASVGAMFAANLNAVILVIAIVLPAAVLFWFLVKALARIQMPTRPGAR